MRRKNGLAPVLLLMLLIFLQMYSTEVGLSGNHGKAVVNSAPVVLTGNMTVGQLLVDNGKSVVVTSSTLILTGNIKVKDQGQLLIVASRIQLSIRGEKPYNISIGNSGKMTVVGSTLETLSGQSAVQLSEESSLSLTNSTVTGFRGIFSSGNSTITVNGGTLNVGYLEHTGKAISIIGGSMPTGLLNVTNWRSRVELEGFTGDTIVIRANSTRFIGLQCNTLLANTTQSIQLNNSKVANCALWSSQKTSVKDSIFGSLLFYSSGVATNVNVTAPGVLARAGGPINVAGANAIVLRYWYLKVKVTDFPGTGIPSKVVVTDYLNNIAATENTDPDGMFMKSFLAEIINVSTTMFVGNYRIKAEYQTYTTLPSPVVLDGDKEIWVRFLESVPIVSTTKLTVSADKIYVDDTIRMEGSINSAKPDEYVQLIAIGPNDTSLQQAVKTDQKGGFKGEFKLDIEGEWRIYADWLGGGSQRMSTKSQAFIVTVQPRPPITLILIRAMPIVIIVLGVLFGFAFLALGRRKKIKI